MSLARFPTRATLRSSMSASLPGTQPWRQAGFSLCPSVLLDDAKQAFPLCLLAASSENSSGTEERLSTSYANGAARHAASGRCAHHGCRTEGWPWRMGFCFAAPLIAASGSAISMSFLRTCQRSAVTSLAPHDISRTGSLFPWSAIMFDLSLSFVLSCLGVLPEAAIGRNWNASLRGTSCSAADAPARNCLTT